MKARRFSYTRIEAGQTVASELAYLPITLAQQLGLSNGKER